MYVSSLFFRQTSLLLFLFLIHEVPNIKINVFPYSANAAPAPFEVMDCDIRHIMWCNPLGCKYTYVSVTCTLLNVFKTMPYMGGMYSDEL